MNFDDIEIVISDLDGTLLLLPSAEISDSNISVFHDLGRAGICRVIATGRSLYSAQKVIPEDFPIDYLIFSSGAGVYDRSSNEIIRTIDLDADKVKHAAEVLISVDVDFSIQFTIPDNHKFIYYSTGRENPDFKRRLDLYRKFAKPMDTDKIDNIAACQLIAILPDDPVLFENIKKRIKGLKVIRSTSPLDGRSIWMEVFSPLVSKAKSIEWLCTRNNINMDLSVGVGNDYNDLDMLTWTSDSYVVSNAPEELRQRFKVVENSDNKGFSRAMKIIADGTGY